MGGLPQMPAHMPPLGMPSEATAAEADIDAPEATPAPRGVGGGGGRGSGAGAGGGTRRSPRGVAPGSGGAAGGSPAGPGASGPLHSLRNLPAQDAFQMSLLLVRYALTICVQRSKVDDDPKAKENWILKAKYMKNKVGESLKKLQGNTDQVQQTSALEDVIKVSRQLFGDKYVKFCLAKAVKTIRQVRARKSEGAQAAAAAAGKGESAGGGGGESSQAERASPKGAANRGKGGKKRKAESPPAKEAAAPAEQKKSKKSHKKKPAPKKADEGGVGDGDLQLVKESLPRPGEEEGDILKDAAIDEEEEREERQTATRRAGASGGRERSLVAGGLGGLLTHVAQAAGLEGASDSAVEVMADAIDILLQRVLMRASTLSAHRLAGASSGSRRIETTSVPLERVLNITRREKAKAERVEAPAAAANNQAALDAEVAERRRKGELQTEEQLKQFMRERENRLKVANATDAARSLGGLGDARWAKWSQIGAKAPPGGKAGGEKGKGGGEAAPAGGLAARMGSGAGAPGGLAARMAAAKEREGKGEGAGAGAGDGTPGARALKPRVAWKDIVAAMEREPQYSRSRWFASVVMAGPGKEEK